MGSWVTEGLAGVCNRIGGWLDGLRRDEPIPRGRGHRHHRHIMFAKAIESDTIEELLDHYDHVVRLASAAHLAAGSNLDHLGYDKMPTKENEKLRSGNKDTYAFPENPLPKSQIIRIGGCSEVWKV